MPATDLRHPLTEALTRELRDYLGRISDSRTYAAPRSLGEVTAQAADWLVTSLDSSRPFVPVDGARDRVREIVHTFLAQWGSDYADAYPEDNVGEIVDGAARSLLARLDEAGLLIPALPDDPDALALDAAIAYVTGRTELRSGTMGDGYYAAHVSSGDIAAALYAAGWRKA